ncbi:hypothetical protein [Bradyrhizobium sp. ORS 375]|uniref:hypothetical protein n=1 Tax=Bradyrhizobium sp. (strain ORS 375) TaxID=566679 RepID=UPI0015844CC5|nr:hypothetical protein [Bradyrhizobium sp. ORS 375]
MSRIDDDARWQSPAHDAGIVQGFEKKSACASSVAPCHHDRRRPVRQQQPLSNIVITECDKRPAERLDYGFTGSSMQNPFRLRQIRRQQPNGIRFEPLAKLTQRP